MHAILTVHQDDCCNRYTMLGERSKWREQRSQVSSRMSRTWPGGHAHQREEHVKNGAVLAPGLHLYLLPDEAASRP